MLRNYTIISLRQMKKQKLYAFIKIAGFACGVAASILLAVFLSHELSYDRYYDRAEDIYRLNITWTSYDNVTGAEFPAPVVDGFF